MSASVPLGSTISVRFSFSTQFQVTGKECPKGCLFEHQEEGRSVRDRGVGDITVLHADADAVHDSSSTGKFLELQLSPRTPAAVQLVQLATEQAHLPKS